MNGKECRALGYDESIQSRHVEKGDDKETDESSEAEGTRDCFVKKIPKRLKLREFHNIFAIYGPILSLKISLNADHSSRGFGYITFQNAESARNAIAKGAHLDPDKLVATAYQQPTDRKQLKEDQP